MLLDRSGLMGCQYASEVEHAAPVRLFRLPQSKLTHAFVPAELAALDTARRLPREKAISMVRAILAHPLVEVVWVERELADKALVTRRLEM